MKREPSTGRRRASPPAPGRGGRRAKATPASGAADATPTGPPADTTPEAPAPAAPPPAVAPATARRSTRAARSARSPARVASPAPGPAAPPAPGAIPASAPQPPAASAAGDGATRGLVADLRPAGRPLLGHIPWGYGEDRVSAMARDPSWMFVYWELTDPAIERARAELGAPEAECHLRIYDTTHRLFDGFNANWFMDVPIYRPANNHYIEVGHAGAVFHVDIGVRSWDGRFAPIARSGAVEMPRESIAAESAAEWMTVMPDSEARGEYVHRWAPRPDEAPAMWAPPPEALERITQALVGEGWTRTEWAETVMGGRTVRWVRSLGPFRWEEWQRLGGTTLELRFAGERQVFRTVEGGMRMTFGPWRVTIRQTDPGGAVRVIDRWAVHYSWEVAGGTARVETAPIIQRLVRAYQVSQVAGSEARLLAGGLSSEVVHVGASEWRWLGASERGLLGASEMRYLGASEFGFMGASELMLIGASELLRVGASELRLGGASELRLGGASEALLGGASELIWGGASERLLGGASERLLGWPTEPRP
jgi:hypothetical protein